MACFHGRTYKGWENKMIQNLFIAYFALVIIVVLVTVADAWKYGMHIVEIVRQISDAVWHISGALFLVGFALWFFTRFVL